MPFQVSMSFSSNSFPLCDQSSMPPPSSSQNPRRNPAIIYGVKRARPRGLWKGRGPASRPATLVAAPTPTTPGDTPHRRIPPESDSDSDRESCSSSVLFTKYSKEQPGSDTPLSTDLDETPHARPLVTKHQSQQHHLRQDYSVIPQQSDESSDDDSTIWTTRTKIMDISSTAGHGDPSPSSANFTYEDWLDLKQLFDNACEQYEFDDPTETLPLLRGVIHECHRCLLAHEDPSTLFAPPQALDTKTTSLPQSGTQTPIGSYSRKTRGPAKPPADLPTAFHTVLGTTLFFFGNSIAADPELALPGEPNNPVPYWIAALDVFESGENLPSRSVAMTYRFDMTPGEYTPPPREDWRMAIMWGRALVALATEIVDRNRTEPPKPPQPQHFPSPFPTNMDYLKTGTIWDDEPEWPPESPFGLIIARRPPITRRMTLNDATPHEMLQIAMDHFSRGIFYMPHNTSSSVTPHSFPSRQTVTPHFNRSKALYEVAEEVLLLAEKLEDPEERKEWAIYADSVFAQIHVSHTRTQQEHTATTASSRSTGEVPFAIGEGLVAKARGRTFLVIGSTIAEIIEEKMDQGSGSEEAIGSLMRSEDAEEARNALLRAVEYFERARSYIVEVDETEDIEGDDDDVVMAVDEDVQADDEQEDILLSARTPGKQRRYSKAEESRRASKLEAKRFSRMEARRVQQRESQEERRQVSHLLAEALCSLANMTEAKEQQEEYYRRAEGETDVKIFDESDDENMDEAL